MPKSSRNIAETYLEKAMEQAEDDIAVVCSSEGINIPEPSDDHPDHWTIDGEVFELIPPHVKKVTT